jgi:predicted nucleic acid-binding protein
VRAVFDTNVVVSALIFGRRLAWLRQAWASGAAIKGGNTYEKHIH